MKSVNREFESIRTSGPKTWQDFPCDIKKKKKESVDILKTSINKWKPDSCSCRLCKTYLQNTGYLWK